MCPSVRTFTESVSDFAQIWCVGRPRPDMPTRVTSTRSKVKVKVKVTKPLKFRKLHFSRCIFSAIFAWGSKVMVGYDSMVPGLQLVEARFSNFLLRKLSEEFKLHDISIFHEFQTVIFRYCVRLQSRGWARW